MPAAIASKIRLTPDLIGGLAMMLLAVIAIISCWHLDTGSLAEIGPGLIPTGLAAILFGLGAAVTFNGFRVRDTALQSWRLRPILFILGAVLIFGLTVRSAGIALASPMALLIAGGASHETRWMEYAVFVVALTVFCTVLFRFLLGQPIPLAPWLVGY